MMAERMNQMTPLICFCARARENQELNVWTKRQRQLSWSSLTFSLTLIRNPRYCSYRF